MKSLCRGCFLCFGLHNSMKILLNVRLASFCCLYCKIKRSLLFSLTVGVSVKLLLMARIQK